MTEERRRENGWDSSGSCDTCGPAGIQVPQKEWREIQARADSVMTWQVRTVQPRSWDSYSLIIKQFPTALSSLMESLMIGCVDAHWRRSLSRHSLGCAQSGLLDTPRSQRRKALLARAFSAFPLPFSEPISVPNCSLLLRSGCREDVLYLPCSHNLSHFRFFWNISRSIVHWYTYRWSWLQISALYQLDEKLENWTWVFLGKVM